MSFTCAFAWLCALLMVPLMLFVWALDTKRTRINRYRSYGWTWKKIAGIYIVTTTTVTEGFSKDKFFKFIRYWKIIYNN